MYGMAGGVPSLPLGGLKGRLVGCIAFFFFGFLLCLSFLFFRRNGLVFGIALWHFGISVTRDSAVVAGCYLGRICHHFRQQGQQVPASLESIEGRGGGDESSGYHLSQTFPNQTLQIPN